MWKWQPKAVLCDGGLAFDHVVVKKEAKTFNRVYNGERHGKRLYTYGPLITHGITFKQACKKAKLIEIGYQLCLEDHSDN